MTSTVAPGVTKRGDSYLAQVMISGKRHAQTFPTKDAAIAWRHRQRAAHRRGQQVADTGGLTLRKWWPEFIATRTDPTTHAKYRSHWNAHIEPTWGGHRLRDVKAADLDKWARGKVRDGLAPIYVQGIVYTLSGMFTEAVHAHKFTDNPVRSMRYRPIRDAVRGEAVTLTDEQVAAVLAQAPDQFTYALVVVMADTGMRRSEAAGLLVGDVRNGFIRVHQRIDSITHRIKPGLKNGSAERKAPLTDRMAEALAPMLAGKSADQLIFPKPNGEPLNIKYWYKSRWQPMVAAAGLPADVGIPTPHDLRHTYLTEAARTFAPHELMVLGGHSDIRSLSRYLHADADLVSRAAASLNARQAKTGKAPRKRPSAHLRAVGD